MQDTIQKVEKWKNATKVFLAVSFLVCGCLIYLLFRSKSLNIYQWCSTIGLSDAIDRVRCLVQQWPIPSFVRYSLPDGLYCAAYILLIDAIWHEGQQDIKYSILTVVPVITISSEVLQYFGLVRGTFDLADLICYNVPPLMYIGVHILCKLKYNPLKFKSL